MCRIAKGKGGSKCPGPEHELIACHALPEGNLVNKADTDFQLAMVYDVFTMCMQLR